MRESQLKMRSLAFAPVSREDLCTDRAGTRPAEIRLFWD